MMSTTQERAFQYLEWAVIFLMANTLLALCAITEHAVTLGDLLPLGHKAAILGMVALGVLVVFYVNEYDLSVGMIFSLCLIVAASLEGIIPPLLLWCTVLMLTGLIGYVNGWFTARFQSGLLITFTMMFVLQGIVNVLSNGMPITHATYLPESFLYTMGWWSFLGLPVSAWIFLGTVLGVHMLFYRSAWGRGIRAIALDSRAAQASGLNIRPYTIGAFIFAAAIAGFASLLYYTRLQTVGPNLGISIPFDALAVVIISNGGMERKAPSPFRLFVVTVLLAGIHTRVDILGLLPNTSFFVTGCLIFCTLLFQYLKNIGQASETRISLHG